MKALSIGNCRYWLLLLLISIGACAQAETYADRADVDAFINEMVSEYGFQRESLNALFANVEKKQSILDAIARPAEKTKPWKDYRKIFVTPSRTEKGVEFMRKNKAALARAEKEFGVPQEIIVAIIGVETRYGQHKGGYRVMDALSTLAFDYPARAPFFRKELKNFLLLARDQKQQPLDLMGSYAGAMGYGQFMPSSYRSYAVDYDGDGLADIWNNPVDAIGSVANYFKRHGWKAGEPVIERALVSKNYNARVVTTGFKPDSTLGQLNAAGFSVDKALPAAQPAFVIELEGERGAEFWLGLPNFYVITRYNHSHMYALAVYQLSQAIKAQS